MRDLAAHRIQAEQVKDVVGRMVRATPDTLHNRQANDLSLEEGSGRFSKPSHVVGNAPMPNYFVRPNWSNSPEPGLEPPIDARDCGNEFGYALGEPHEQPNELSNPEPYGSGVALVGHGPTVTPRNAVAETLDNPAAVSPPSSHSGVVEGGDGDVEPACLPSGNAPRHHPARPIPRTRQLEKR